MDETPQDHRVRGAGVTLAVREHSRPGPGKQHLLLVHGYPDQQEVWRRVIRELDHDQLHIVTYDVRGAGASDVPRPTAAYRTERLVDDFVAVLEATVPGGEAVHLVGHDWGSVQLWDAVAAERSDPRLQGRIASFTSISGPSLDHAARLSRHRAGRRLLLSKQALHSWYIYAFQVPVLPEILWSAAGRTAVLAGSARLGDRLRHNAVNGLKLYRANFVRRMTSPGVLRTDVPVQVIHPTRDAFVSEVMLEGLREECTDVTVVRMDASHWVQLTEPAELAHLIEIHVRATAGSGTGPSAGSACSRRPSDERG